MIAASLERWSQEPTRENQIALGLALADERERCGHGEWEEFLRSVGVEWSNPREWARRLIESAQRAVGAEEIDLPPVVAEYYAELCAIARMTGAMRTRAIERLVHRRWADWPRGWIKPARSRATAYRHLECVGRPAKLVRRRRCDRGRVAAMPPAVAEMYRMMRVAPTARPTTAPAGDYLIQCDDEGGVTVVSQTTGQRLERTSLVGRLYDMPRTTAVRLFKQHCPHARGAADAAFARIDRSIHPSLVMNRKHRRHTYERMEHGWEPPSLGYWAYDFSIADVIVRVQQGNTWRVCRPYIVNIVDQLSHMPMALLASVEAPSKYAFRSALLQAIFPKSERWHAHGFPLGLYGDWGEVQRSRWMQGLVRSSEAELGRRLKVDHTPMPYSPWSNGSSETLFKDVHQDFERGWVRDRWPVSYVGRNTDARPEHWRRWSGPQWVRRDDPQVVLGCPTIDEYNALLIAWAEDYVRRQPSRELAARIGFSRDVFWSIKAAQEPETVAVPDENVVRSWLMERMDNVTVHPGGRIQINAVPYQSPELIGYDGGRVRVLYDFANIADIRVHDPDTNQLIAVVHRSDLGGDETAADFARRRAENRARARRIREAFEIVNQTPHLVEDSAPDTHHGTQPSPVLRPTPEVLEMPRPAPPRLEPVEPTYIERIGPDGTPLRIATAEARR